MIGVCGIKGTVGASTLALLTRALWPAPAVLVEADPAGGEFGLTLSGPQGQALPAKPSISDLALAAAHQMPSLEQVWAAALATTAGPVVCGLPSAQPMGNLLREYGRPLAATLVGEADVVVDAGRLAADTPSLPLLAAANVVAVVLPDRAEALFRLTDLLPGLASVMRVAEDVRSVIVPVVVAAPHRGEAAAGEVDETMAQHHIPVRPARWFGWDPKAVDLVRAGDLTRVQRSALLRSARVVVGTLAAEQASVIEQRTARARLSTAQFSDASAQWRGVGRPAAAPPAPPVSGYGAGVRSRG